MPFTTRKDNSYGAGYYPLPPKLSYLGVYADSLRPMNLVDHKVFPDEGIHMLTTRCGHRLSIMAQDMKTLLRLGLVRIQSNEPGTISFYFYEGDGPKRLSPERDPRRRTAPGPKRRIGRTRLGSTKRRTRGRLR